ncbi:hypothetical protein VNO77_21471 [Canavalia gladiata]|uniref:Uncharacterized protein n=1 Tax=Canavalia gladiata TaxID=3824 RepID=A0AAN9QRK7_CANGL
MLEAGGEPAATWTRMCDTCRSAPCTVFCRADSAYLCAGCDARVHAVNLVASRHERVWVCEACERAPAAFLCKADAASLCASCDADIHSANPLASRHHRVPILPISGNLYGPHADVAEEEEEEEEEGGDVEDEDEAASWLLLNPVKSNGVNNNTQQSNGFLFGGEVDEYLDLVDDNNHFTATTGDHYNQQHQHQHFGGVSHKAYHGDSVVPVQQHHQGQHFQLALDFDSPKPGFSYNGSVSQTVSVSSMDVGVVPESTIRDVSIGHSRPPKGTIDLFSGPPIQMPSHLTPMDREARVLRYREKKKTRKFEKTIRYASRKAYAETRPRIKGRFAKRTDVEAEVDQMFSTSLITEVGYGIVPSF